MTTALTQPWAQRLAWTLLHFLWQGTLLAALYALARLAGGRGLAARARYAMACASLLAMALAPAATYLWLARSAATAAARVEVAPFGPRPIAAGSLASLTANPWQVALPWIVMVWFAGVAACSVRLAAGWLSASRLRSAHSRPAPAEWQGSLDRLLERMLIARRVRLLLSSRVECPSVIGWLRPVILVPLGLVTGLAPEHVEALLAHELAHIRRHDYLVNVLQGIAESLLFYHPAVWWISGQIRAEREHCCDDLAVAASGDVLTYARALAELESSRPAHFKAALAANDGSLVRRIRRLLDPNAHAPSDSGAAWLLSVLMLAAIGSFALRAAPRQSPTIKRDSIWIDTVKQGDMVIEVRALGTLTSTRTAELQVAPQFVPNVAAGQAVVMDCRTIRKLLSGAVKQVRPGVINRTVTVDVQVNGDLPPGIALPAQVDGVIHIGDIYNVLYVGRPVSGGANSEATLYKIEPDGQSAIPVKVQFGAASVNKIQIKSGLQPGDKIILSDMAAYQKYDRVELR